MMDLLTSAMDAGAALAETFSKPVNTGASFTRYGTVVKNNGTTLDVELCGATLAAVPMLTTCAGAKAGDRCLLTVDGPLVTVTGILANADNAHYVNRIVPLWSGLVRSQETITLDASWKNYCIFGAFYRDWSSALICWYAPVTKRMEFIGGADDGSNHEYYLASFKHVSENTFYYEGGNAHPVKTTAFRNPVDLPITNIYGLV